MIEKGTHLRIKLIGTRSDVGSMFAIGSIKEDFLGYAHVLISLDSADYFQEHFETEPVES